MELTSSAVCGRVQTDRPATGQAEAGSAVSDPGHDGVAVAPPGAPNLDFARVNQSVLDTLYHTTWRFWLLVGVLSVVLANGVYAFSQQVRTGLWITNFNRPVVWGVYEGTFVFWIGISHSGTMLSAILRLTQADWRRAIYRAAEAMTVFSLVTAACCIFAHLGRVWLAHWVMPFAHPTGVWPNFRSPLIWDAAAISTYLTGSSIFLFVGMIPDIAILRDRASGWRRGLYRVLALGWRGTMHQWKTLDRACILFAALIIPVFVSVHSIVSWDFAMTTMPGWHATLFAPYFVVGAILSGISGVVTLSWCIRTGFKLQHLITPRHFDCLGQILFAVSGFWAWFFAIESFTVLYSQNAIEMEVLTYRFGDLREVTWLMIACNFLIPFPLFAIGRVRRNPNVMLVISLLVNVGMWLERYVIIPHSLARAPLSFDWTDYLPSYREMSIVAGTFAVFSLLMLVYVKLFPAVSMWEINERLDFYVPRVGCGSGRGA
jgi:molybdopterin-containing oxidoreductase family membrane subunit